MCIPKTGVAGPGRIWKIRSPCNVKMKTIPLRLQVHALAIFAVLVSCAPDVNFAAEPLQPVRVSDNGHYFVKADGTPFFWLGDTAWSIFNHPKPEDVDIYLNDRAAKGFTVIQGVIALWDYT